MREMAYQNFNRRQNELITLKAETGHVFEQEKKRLHKAERLLKIEQERKELLSLNDEKEKD